MHVCYWRAEVEESLNEQSVSPLEVLSLLQFRLLCNFTLGGRSCFKGWLEKLFVPLLCWCEAPGQEAVVVVVFTGGVSLQGWDFPPSVCRSLVVGGGGSCGLNREASGGSLLDSTEQRLRVEDKPSSSFSCISSSFCSSSSSSWPRLRAVGCAETGGAVNAVSLPSSTPPPPNSGYTNRTGTVVIGWREAPEEGRAVELVYPLLPPPLPPLPPSSLLQQKKTPGKKFVLTRAIRADAALLLHSVLHNTQHASWRDFELACVPVLSAFLLTVFWTVCVCVLGGGLRFWMRLSRRGGRVFLTRPKHWVALPVVLNQGPAADFRPPPSKRSCPSKDHSALQLNSSWKPRP